MRRSSRRQSNRQARAWLVCGAVLLTVFSVLLTFALRGGYDTFVRAVYPMKYTETVEQACADFGVSESLVYAILRNESDFDPNALSVADARGLMQVTQTGLEWAQMRIDEYDGVTVDGLYDPTVNIRCGVYILSLLFEEFDNEQTVIAAYNAGIGNVQSWLTDEAYSADGITLHTVPFGETRRYIRRVTSSKEMYQTYYELP